MKLSRLEIFGFKSFAKKLDLKLLGGMTSIVGPNGCGKTNVVDAIRWVLGEQRPSQIRLEKMEDVIFKGSATRKPLGIAEVSLTFENSYGILPFNLPEVTITRRLFRSGESEYMINRRQCRLTDINDMFMDTGIGTDSYSLFEQNMINSILSDKTEDRRNVFDEASGVTKYKARRKSALHTLIGIDDDLNRINDIVAELERRVDALKRQAAKASRYRELKSELKSKTINLASYEIGILKSKITGENSDIVSVQNSIERLKSESANIEAQMESLSVETGKIERKLAEIAGQYEANTQSGAEKRNEIARLESRIESLAEIGLRARENAKRNSESIEKLAESHGACSENLTKAETLLKEIESRFSVEREGLKVLDNKLAEKTAMQKNLEMEYRRIEREISSDKAALDNIKSRRSYSESRLREISVKSEELTGLISEINSEISSYQEKKLLLSQEKNALETEISNNKTKLSELLSVVENLNKTLLSEKSKEGSVKAETDFLTKILNSFEGYSEGVKTASGAPGLKDKIHGVLADLISCNETYAKAAGCALEGCIQALIVDCSDTALTGAKFLSGEKRGRAIFLPLDNKSRFPLSSKFLSTEPGVIGPVYNFIRTDNSYYELVKNILGSYIIVDNLDTAVKLQKENPGFVFVTLDGQLAGIHGEIRSGENGTGTFKLGRIERLANLKSALSDIEKTIKETENKIKSLSAECDTVKIKIKDTGEKLETASSKYSEITSLEVRAAAKKDAANETLENLKTEASKISASFKEYGETTKKIEEKLEKLTKDFNIHESRLGETASEIRELREETDNLRTKINSFEIERAALREKKTALTHEIEMISERREALALSSRRTQKEVEDAEKETLEIGEKLKTLKDETSSLSTEHEHIEKTKTETEKHYSELKNLKKEKEAAIHEINRRLVELSKSESSHSLEKEEASMLLRNINERLSEEYFLNPDEIPETDIGSAINTEEEKLILNDLRRKIQFLGDVNLAAETDYNEEKTRLDFITGEREDLIQAKKSLLETISKVNQAANSRFLETLEQIKVNFQKTFREFFEGGVCDLELEASDDPLEANILITARPPGKNVRSINLLSSGEKALTAISLLFAIYMVKPSPFCILDEVDAPLDDANIDRFLHVIGEFSKNTQFIIVTHNKKTMARANNLYGITMEEPGLSGLVSVRLSEVDIAEKEPVKRENTLETV